MVVIKENVKVNGLKPEMLLGIYIANSIYEHYGIDMVITEVTGGKHGTGSLHYVGMAVDLRTRNVEESLRKPLAEDIRKALGNEYDVVLESNHIHIEYQPK